MKYLTLIRHAKSSWGDFSLSDFERPLCESEMRVVPVVGKFIREVYLESNISEPIPYPKKVLTSSALRAKGTAELMMNQLCPDVSDLAYEEVERLYHAPAGDYLEIVRKTCDSLDHLVLVGHNPGLSVFASDLLKDDEVEELATCGGVILKIPLPVWSAINWEHAEFIGKFSPRMVEKRWKLDLSASQF